MDKIKNLKIVKFLMDKNLTAKVIKLSILLILIFITFFNQSFGYVAFAFCAVYTIFEFSADSVLWLSICGLLIPYIKLICINILIYEMIAILIIRLVIDIIKRPKEYENWRFITVAILFGALSLTMLLPLSTTYSFGSHLKKLAFFMVLVLIAINVKQINIKHLFMLFAISVATLCILFVIAQSFGGGIDMVITHEYSKGVVERFSFFYMDPNLTGAILICAIACWFVLYKKNNINKYLYFIVLAILGIFSLMTLSKATCLIIGMLGLFILVENIVITIKGKNYKHLLELLWYVGVLVFICLIGWKYVDALYIRIFGSGATSGTGEAMSNLTTGRTDLWKSYLEAIFSSWQMALFGSGVNSGQVVKGMFAHNVPIEYLYKFGIVSVSLLLAMFIILILPYIKNVKIYNYIPLVLIFGIFCSIGSTSSKYVYAFTIIFTSLCYNGKEKVEDDANIVEALKQNINSKEELN